MICVWNSLSRVLQSQDSGTHYNTTAVQVVFWNSSSFYQSCLISHRIYFLKSTSTTHKGSKTFLTLKTAWINLALAIRERPKHFILLCHFLAYTVVPPCPWRIDSVTLQMLKSVVAQVFVWNGWYFHIAHTHCSILWDLWLLLLSLARLSKKTLSSRLKQSFRFSYLNNWDIKQWLSIQISLSLKIIFRLLIALTLYK